MGKNDIHKLLIQRLQRRIEEVEGERDKIAEALHTLSNESLGKIYILQEEIQARDRKIKELEDKLDSAEMRIKFLEKQLLNAESA